MWGGVGWGRRQIGTAKGFFSGVGEGGFSAMVRVK